MSKGKVLWREDTICISEDIEPNKKEQERLRSLECRIKMGLMQEEETKIIDKEELKNHQWLVIEPNYKDDGEWGNWQKPTVIGLIDTKVDETRKELTGTRVSRMGGVRFYRRYTFRMSGYNRLWRAWTRPPKERYIWPEEP